MLLYFVRFRNLILRQQKLLSCVIDACHNFIEIFVLQVISLIIFFTQHFCGKKLIIWILDTWVHRYAWVSECVRESGRYSPGAYSTEHPFCHLNSIWLLECVCVQSASVYICQWHEWFSTSHHWLTGVVIFLCLFAFLSQLDNNNNNTSGGKTMPIKKKQISLSSSHVISSH